jgi:hypothetical protein
MAKNSYLLAIFAGIIGIIVLITPVAFHDSSFGESYIWTWGLYTWKILLGDTEFYFTDDTEYLTWGLISTLIILIATISILASARKASKRNRNYGAFWIFCGILFIAAPLIFYFGLTSEMPTWLSDLFWDFYSFHFAFFGSFVAGVFALISAFIK